MRISIVVSVCALLVSHTAWADADSRRFVLACRDFVKIYKTGDETKPFSGFFASPDDALRAGYCRGVIAEYRRANRYSCANADIMQQATTIAGNSYQQPIAELLRRSCGD